MLACSWLRTCTEEHDCLSTSAQVFPDRVLPSRLICLRGTTVRLCLSTELPTNTPYATLSHCWETIEQFTIRKENLISLQESIPVHLLSKTFQDAIFLTSKFRYQYLWIDSLCIVQDDSNDWRNGSSLMASTYGGTSLNIAASHAQDGSVGWFVERSPSDVAPCLVSLKGLDLPERVVCVPIDFYNRGIWHTALRRRAWAFQGRLLSPRTLSFSSTQIFWGCQRLEACESFPISIPSAVHPAQII
jgi:hypothetical protein